MHAGSANVLDRLSYILASRQREKVLAAVIPGPQTPVQIAKRTGLRLPHVSRTLGQLVRADLAQCVSGERRGKLYAASGLGVAVFSELSDARGDRLIAPMIRGSHFRNYHHWIATHHGRAAVSVGTLVAFTTLQQALFGPSVQLLQVGITMQSSLALFEAT